MNPIQFPQCSTCPYWMPGDYDHNGVPERADDDDGPETGECHRHAPVMTVWEPHGGPLFIDFDKHSMVWPRTNGVNWCGDHPSMPAFLADRYQTTRKPIKTSQ